MFVKQISVFLENTEGRLDEVLKILAQGGIDLLSASLADTMEYVYAADDEHVVGSSSETLDPGHCTSAFALVVLDGC